MHRPGEGKQSTSRIQTWELDLIRKVANAFRTQEREELEAELARKLVDLKSRPLLGIRDWKAYLAKFLYNKAANWIRDSRARENRTARQMEGQDEAILSLPGPAVEDDLAIAFRDLYNELDPELRRFCQILIEENGNQVATARRLGKHRNTIRLWIGKIRTALQRHGF
jgi:DNA-directed RNA polymerase specialized sigma24 family protein